MAKKRMAKTAPWKDRIRELRRVPASSLVRHPKNPRQHPESQKAAMQAMLKRVGYADALLVREDTETRLHPLAHAAARALIALQLALDWEE